MGHEEQNTTNTNLNQSNEVINMDIDGTISTQNDGTLDDDDDDVDDDDDDTQSVDFVPGSNEIHPGDDESLNSSRSSLQQPPSAIFKGLLITRQMSATSQPIHNPIYTGMPSNMNNTNRRLTAFDTGPISNVNQLPSLQKNTNESNVQMRKNVRYSFFKYNSTDFTDTKCICIV
jgi:hypothetical protein